MAIKKKKTQHMAKKQEQKIKTKKKKGGEGRWVGSVLMKEEIHSHPMCGVGWVVT